jgi:hypothetical protein
MQISSRSAASFRGASCDLTSVARWLSNPRPEPILAWSRSDDGTGDMANGFQRAIETTPIHLCQRTRLNRLDRALYVLQLRLAQIVELHANAGESAARCAVEAVSVADARFGVLSVGPSQQSLELERSSAGAVLAQR